MSASGNNTYERGDVTQRGVIVFTVAFAFVTLALIALLTLFIQAAWRLPESPTERLESMEIGPAGAASLQVDPGEELDALTAEKRDRLTSFGWVEREAGVAHVPIEEAMRLTVDEARRENRQ